MAIRMCPILISFYIYDGDHKCVQEHEYTIYLPIISIIQYRTGGKLVLKWTVLRFFSLKLI